MRRLAPGFVFVVTAAVFAPALGYNLIFQWDDSGMFTLNPMLRAWSWSWMATTFYMGHWMPLSWLLATVNFHLWGLPPADVGGAGSVSAAGWHAVSVGLHAVNAVLVYLIARRLVGSTWGAIVAALVFSVHPLRIESVAQVTEERDVLMGVFFLGAGLLWMQGRRWWAFAAFVLACLSKSLAVSLPLMLLALEWYRAPRWEPQKRVALGWVVRDLAPFFAVSVVVSLIAFRALATVGNSMAWSIIPLHTRLLHVAYSEMFYAWQTVWPARLSHLIEYTWRPSWDQPQYPMAVAVCALVALVCWTTRHRWPALTPACLAYAISILPQAGLFQNGPQLVANRYSYLACVPLVLLAGGAFTTAWRHAPRLSLGLTTSVVGGLIAVTLVALPMWRNSHTLWEYAAQHEPTCNWCLDIASVLALRRGDVEQARRYTVQAIAVSATTELPRWERHWNLAAIDLKLGRRDDAIRDLRTYLAAVPASRAGTASDQSHIASAREALTTLEGR